MDYMWLDDWLIWLANRLPESNYLSVKANLFGLVAIFLVCFMCGSVGSLVVGNRMAFFSDALAHCAFAGIALALMIGLLTEASPLDLEPWIPAIMVGFGALVGLGIAFVRDKTALASDTVIGVFFAGAIGLGAVMLAAAAARSFYNPESFLFGGPAVMTGYDILTLLVLSLVTIGFLLFTNNLIVFASFNASLALSRQIPTRFLNYAFIILLAVIVNLCLKTVGALLINALLIVPAATAANLCRNMRQLFWCSIALSLFCGIFGQWVSWHVAVLTGFHPGESGTIVVLAVILFFVSMAVGPWLKNRRAAQSGKDTALASRAK